MKTSFAQTFVGQTMNLDLTKTLAGPKNITGLCTDLFLIVIRMREAEDLGEPEALRKLILHYLDLFSKNCKTLGVSADAIADAKYALVAIIDETVLSVPGNCRDFWLSHPVQLDLFGNNLAGQEFFTRLERLTLQIEKARDVVEIYYICLSLGFEGKYKIANPEERAAIIDDLGLKLKRARGKGPSLLSPHSYIEEGARQRMRTTPIPLWLVGAIAAGACVVWYGVWFSINTSRVNHVLQLIQSLGS